MDKKVDKLREMKHEFIKKNNRLPEKLYLNTFTIDDLDLSLSELESHLRVAIIEVVSGHETGRFE